MRIVTGIPDSLAYGPAWPRVPLGKVSSTLGRSSLSLGFSEPSLRGPFSPSRAWLANAGVSRAIFSHFGKDPIEMGDGELKEALAALATEKAHGCRVDAATDGAEFEL